MYIPITLYGGKCVNKFYYGFDILEKLEICTHENQNPTKYDNCCILYTKLSDPPYVIFEHNFEVFRLFFSKGISFVK